MVWLLPAAGSARFLVIVTLAWIVGGVVLVSMLNHAQVKAEL